MSASEDLEAIRLFIRVAEESSFSGAARRSGISATAATRRISALEAALQTRLLSRSTRRVSLTQDGERYLEHARVIVDAVDVSREALGATRQAPRGRLRVTARASLGQHLLIPDIPEFRRRYPDISIGLELNESELDLIGEGFDIGLTIGHQQSSSLVARTLASTDSLVCAAPAYLERHGTPAEPAALEHHDCITFQARRGTNTWRFSHGAQELAVRIRGPVAVNNGEALVQLGRDGLGIILVADWLVRDDLAAGNMVRLFGDYDIEPRGTPIIALYPSRNYLPQKVRVFIDFLAETIPRRLAP